MPAFGRLALSISLRCARGGQEVRQTAERLQWAWERMLEPLLDAEDKGFLGWRLDELSEPERREFVTASLKREKTVFRWLPDRQWAQHATRQS
jgi:hypothetical protein